MIKTVLEFLNEISLPKPDKNSYAANFLKLYENGSEATYVHITKENAYGKEYLQISNDTGACMSDRVQPSEPVSYIDLIQLSDNICTVAEHARSTQGLMSENPLPQSHVLSEPFLQKLFVMLFLIQIKNGYTSNLAMSAALSKATICSREKRH